MMMDDQMDCTYEITFEVKYGAGILYRALRSLGLRDTHPSIGYATFTLSSDDPEFEDILLAINAAGERAQARKERAQARKDRMEFCRLKKKLGNVECE